MYWLAKNIYPSSIDSPKNIKNLFWPFVENEKAVDNILRWAIVALHPELNSKNVFNNGIPRG